MTICESLVMPSWFVPLNETVVPVRPTAAVDTIGAGDAYMSGLIAAIVQRVGVSDATAGRFTAEQLAGIGRVAAVSSGLKVARAGAMPPTAAELEAESAWA